MPFDTAALTRPPSRAENDQLKGQYPDLFAGAGRIAAMMRFSWVGGTVVLLALAYFSSGPVRVFFLVSPLLTGAALWLLLRHLLVQRAQLAAFATANNFRFEVRSSGPAFPWLLPPGSTTSGFGERLISQRPGSLVEAGAHVFPAPEFESNTADWNYLAFRLEQALPHVVLTSAAHIPSSMWKLPVPFPGSDPHQLSQGFTAYVEPQHRHQVAAMFPPEILAVFQGDPEGMDVEVTDTWLFCYSNRGLSPSKPRTWELAERVESEVVPRLSGLEFPRR